MKKVKVIFDVFATKATKFTGSPWCFMAACIIIVVWALSGSFFHYSDTWQLIINTGTTVITFLMVFLIQYSQNKDTKALHIKTDAIIGGLDKVDNSLRGVEKKTEIELEELQKETIK